MVGCAISEALGVGVALSYEGALAARHGAHPAASGAIRAPNLALAPRRRLDHALSARAETDATVAGFLVAYLLLSPVLARQDRAICPFRRLTGHRCPLCGLTHSLASLMRGDLRGSLKAHPLGWLVAGRIVFAANSAMTRPRARAAPTGQPWSDRTASHRETVASYCVHTP
jgi:hypothetical protein